MQLWAEGSVVVFVTKGGFYFQLKKGEVPNPPAYRPEDCRSFCSRPPV
jgi:hypothetical protein